MPLIVIIAIRSSPNKTLFSMREGRLTVGRYNSYHIVQKAEKVELPMVSPTFSVLFIIISNIVLR